MEESRLKVMQPYDPAIFNDLYNKVRPLKRKLASEIDSRRFGVDYDEVCSWFDIKFIYVFNKYQNTKPDLLLGYLINALKMFKFRILRSAYTFKHSQNITSLEDYHINITEDERVEKSDKVHKLYDFMQSHLSDNAFELFKLQLNPPPFILNKMAELDLSSSQKIPDSVILDYYELGTSHDSYRLLKYWRKEIKVATNMAKEFFNEV